MYGRHRQVSIPKEAFQYFIMANGASQGILLHDCTFINHLSCWIIISKNSQMNIDLWFSMTCKSTLKKGRINFLSRVNDHMKLSTQM